MGPYRAMCYAHSTNTEQGDPKGGSGGTKQGPSQLAARPAHPYQGHGYFCRTSTGIKALVLSVGAIMRTEGWLWSSLLGVSINTHPRRRSPEGLRTEAHSPQMRHCGTEPGCAPAWAAATLLETKQKNNKGYLSAVATTAPIYNQEILPEI